MANNARKLQIDEGNSRMEPDILHAAMCGDIDEAKAALQEFPLSYKRTGNYNQSVLQIAMQNFHKEFGLYILNNTEISTRGKDAFGKDALDTALVCSNNELGEAIWLKWNEERSLELFGEKPPLFTPQP
ncbi:MAG: hypothetical protein KZQ89_02935 [Candidatus Thiodiazotropha sp. (ex Lucinoma kastoroae)]|nr:hypothetical protein [Candidatus Thiodiazotropha sp. (ex Lucinoma kastoroae)]